MSGNAPSPFALFSIRAFTILWCAGTVANVVRWLEMLAVGVFVFQVTASPFQVTLMIIARMAPLAVMGIFAGAIAERFDRRLILLWGYAASVVLSLLLGMLALSGCLEVWHVAVGCLLNGVFWATDFPARRTLLGEVAGAERIGTAMSLDSITGNGTRMLGPLMGGAVMAMTGIAGAYLFGAVLYVVGFFILLGLGHRDPPGDATAEPVLPQVLAGLRHIRDNRPLTGTLMITIVFNLFGFPVTAMVPVIAKDVLDLGPFPVGLLASAEGAGALTAALLITTRATPRHFRRLYFYGVFLYLDMALLFSTGHLPWLSGMLLFIMGLGAAAFASMQATLTFLHAAPEYRRRVMGVLTVCIGSGPLGFAHLGLMAELVGAPLAIAILAVEGIAALLIVLLLWPEVD